VENEAVKNLLQERIATEHVEVEGDGRHFNVLVVSGEFAGLSPVKKQQVVYAALNSEIASGDIHAVNMKTLTPEEWQS